MKAAMFNGLAFSAVIASLLGGALSPAFADDAMLPEVLRPIPQQDVREVINPDEFKDNLGNHIAEQDLDMAGNDLLDAGMIDGSIFRFDSGQTAGLIQAGSIVSGNMNADNGRIIRVQDPSADTDAVNLRTMRAEINAGRDNLGNHIATRVLVMDGNPISTGDVTGVDGSGNVTVPGGMVIQDQTISGLIAPSSPFDAANKAYVDAVKTDLDMGTIVRTFGDQSIDGTKTFLRKIIATGGMDAANAKIINLADATSPQDAVNLRTLQDAISSGGDNLGNHTATTMVDMSSNRIVNVANPTGTNDAANKAYVDMRATYTGAGGITVSAGRVISTDSTIVKTFGNQAIDGVKQFYMTIDASAATSIRLRNGMTGRGVLLSNNGTTTSLSITADGDARGNSDGRAPFAMNNSSGEIVTKTRFTAESGSGYQPLRVRRGNSNVNALMTFLGDDASNVVLGMGDSNKFAIGNGDGSSSVDLRWAQSPSVFEVDSITGNVRWKGVATGEMNAANRRLQMVADPTAAQDAVNLRTMQAAIVAGGGGGGGAAYTAGSGISIDGSNVVSVDSSVIRTTGPQTISGTKTFSGSDALRLATGSSGLLVNADRIRTSSDTPFGIYAGRKDLGAPDGERASIVLDTRYESIGGDSSEQYKSPLIRLSIPHSVQIDGNGFYGNGVNPKDTGNGDIIVAGYRNVNILRPVNIAGALTVDPAGTRWDEAAVFNLPIVGNQGITVNPGSGQMIFNGTIYAGAYNSTSDERLKKNIEAISPDEGMEIIAKVSPVSYDFRDDGRHGLGVIAQEMQEIMPWAVSEREDGMLTVDYTQLIAPLTASTQHLNEKLSEMQDLLDEERARNAELESRLEKIEEALLQR